MYEFRLKNVTAPGYKPPATWEEFEALDRPARIIAARHFLREAAIRLQSYGHRSDDLISAFGAIPEWVSHQLHEHKREQSELRKTWVCQVEECRWRGPKHEFFKDRQLDLLNNLPMARCPECGQCDAEEEQVPGMKLSPLGKLRKVEEDKKVVAQNIDKKAPGYVGDVGKPCDDCEGKPCPVCQRMGESAVVKNHHCDLCQTTFCPDCHGIKRAQLSIAYDERRRCRCKEREQ